MTKHANQVGQRLTHGFIIVDNSDNCAFYHYALPILSAKLGGTSLNLFAEILILREINASQDEEAECVRPKRSGIRTSMLMPAAAPA
ncbi:MULTISPECIES: hypothetical protein [Mesorhizobium]|uniref:hypothetical protein n=1 Tax=Mesorhizobium TaxID=68287 RepID=UPI0003CF5770|nr:hypothetical protein [Mesorhizobium sp. LNHC229A00]ESY90264.1 hypothetical protein X741_27810 [Mesorhizobium sp. LNHC229A00]